MNSSTINVGASGIMIGGFAVPGGTVSMSALAGLSMAATSVSSLGGLSLEDPRGWALPTSGFAGSYTQIRGIPAVPVPPAAEALKQPQPVQRQRKIDLDA